MRNYLRQLILFIIGLLLIVGVYIVDVIFYRVPNFIKVFRIEREVATVVAILLIFPFIRALYIKYIQSMKSRGILLISLISGLAALLFLPQIILKKYIVLWDNNPMLAEFPVIWNLYSVLCATFFSVALMLLFYIIKQMIFQDSNQLVKAGYNLTFFILMLGAVLLNFLEDRYLYQPVLDGYIGLFNDYKIGIISFMILSAGVSINGNWLDDLNRKGKILYTVGGIVFATLLILLFSSKHIVAVYSFGTTIKGFILIGFLFVLVFFVVSVLKLLIHLPTAAKYDRVTMELDYLSKIEQEVKNAQSTTKSVVNMIIKMAKDITGANGCWLEVMNKEEMEIVESINIDQHLIEDIGYFTMDDLKVELIEKREVCIIPNIYSNPLTKHFKLLNCSWKSMIAIPLQIQEKTQAVLYIVKNKTSGFDEKDQKTLSRFVVHLEKNMGTISSDAIKNSLEKIQLMTDKYSINMYSSDRMTYEYLSGKQDYMHCIFGLENKLSQEKMAELRGSLKVLLQLNNDIDPIVNSLREILKSVDRKVDFIFYFIDSKIGRLEIYKSDKLYYITSSEDCFVDKKDDKVVIDLGIWGIFGINEGIGKIENKKALFIDSDQYPSNEMLEDFEDCLLITSQYN